MPRHTQKAPQRRMSKYARRRRLRKQRQEKVSGRR